MRIPRFNRLLAAGAVFSLVLAFCALKRPAPAQQAVIGPITQTFTSTGSAPVKACGLRGENSATFQATGSGPIDAQGSNDGFSWTAVTISTMAGAAQAQPFSPTSGTTYQITPLNADCIQIIPDSTWSGQTVTITFKASSAIAQVPTPAPAGSGASNVTIVAPTDGSGNVKVNCATGCAAGQTFPTSSPGNAQLVVPANASAAPYTAALPFPVTEISAAPGTTPIPFPASQTVNCSAAANCPVNATQVTSPWAISNAPAATASPNGAPTPLPLLPVANCQPSATVVSCQTITAGVAQVNTPAPLASESPVPFPALAHLYLGSSTTLYLDTYPDTLFISSNVTSATTTQLVAGVANQNMYVYLLYEVAGGTQSTATVQFQWGTGATCTGSPKTLFPIAWPAGAAANSVTAAWVSSPGGSTAAVGPPGPAGVPLIIASGGTAVNLCAISAGTTISQYYVVYYAIHAN